MEAGLGRTAQLTSSAAPAAPAITRRRSRTTGTLAGESGTIAYGPNNADQVRRTASYVDKILKGAKPGDLPIQFSEKFDLKINLKTAQVLGLSIPPSVLVQATDIIR